MSARRLCHAMCAEEIIAQERAAGLRFARIVLPNGSSGTHAGLAAGLKAAGDEPSRIQSFTELAPIGTARTVTAELAAQTFALMDPGSTFAEGDILVAGGQLGDGFGVPTAAMFEAVRLCRSIRFMAVKRLPVSLPLSEVVVGLGTNPCCSS